MKAFIFLSITILVILFLPASSFASTQALPPPIQVQYDLPYPGVLPDNPLYFLKVARDRMILFFISTPLKKSQFELLQADKRLNAAYLLKNEGSKNDILISSTASKAENYFNESVDAAEVAKASGIDVSDQANKLLLSSQKHYQILRQMEQFSSPTFKQSLRTIEIRVLAMQKNVKSLLKQKQSKTK